MRHVRVTIDFSFVGDGAAAIVAAAPLGVITQVEHPRGSCYKHLDISLFGHRSNRLLYYSIDNILVGCHSTQHS